MIVIRKPQQFDKMFTVEKKDAVAAVKENIDADFLVLSWPVMPSHNKENRDVALETLKAWDSRGPVLHIGEIFCGGCTGSEGFLNLLQEKYTDVEIDGYQSILNMNDSVIIHIPKQTKLPSKPLLTDRTD
ncbi:hypothetical protein CI610_00700 [invertebrate metagenome]|uniref:Uncharacterized protein n=1 Tax=invertebrate metagenome TaxID=1711999 RepID=A0A2H9TAQ6_9ZZZZ